MALVSYQRPSTAFAPPMRPRQVASPPTRSPDKAQAHSPSAPAQPNPSKRLLRRVLQAADICTVVRGFGPS